jgi:ABC-type glycerol-3-phosphate transport system substrate-binding protein
MKKFLLCLLALSVLLSLTMASFAAADDAAEEEDEENYETGDASLDDPRNQDEIGEQELLVVSFGTSFNDSRRLTIGAIEGSLAESFPDWSVRRGFTSQIIIDHVLSRDGVAIDNVTEALTWASNLWNNYARGSQEGENWDYFKEVFKSGNCGFYIYQTYGGYNEGTTDFSDMQDDWGCVAIPKGPKGDDYYYITSDNVTVVPSIYDAETTRNIEYIYALYNTTAPGVDDEDAWIGSKYKICSDTRAVDETYAMLRESNHAKSDKSLYLGDNNLILGSTTYGNYLWGMRWSTPAALYEGISSAWEGLCAVFNGDMSREDFDKMMEEKKAAEEAAAAAAEETAEEAPAE